MKKIFTKNFSNMNKYTQIFLCYTLQSASQVIKLSGKIKILLIHLLIQKVNLINLIAKSYALKFFRIKAIFSQNFFTHNKLSQILYNLIMLC